MTITVTIHSYPGNQNTKKAQIAAKFGNEVEVVYDSTFQMGVTNKSAEFLKLNPSGKVPVAITPDGPLFESNAIARYARKSDKALLGNNDYEASVIDQWIDFSTNEISSVSFGVLGHVFGYVKQATKEGYDAQVAKVVKALGWLESALGAHTFLVADRITLADIVVVVALASLFNNAFGEDVAANYPKLVKFLTTAVAQPQFQGIETITIKPTSYVFA